MGPSNQIAALDWPRSFAQYSPAELSEISGLSGDMQRVWRGRGHLNPVSSGHARFTPAEVIEISIRYALSKLGVPPTKSHTIPAGAVSGALYHALIDHHGSCEIIGPPDAVETFLQDDHWPNYAFLLSGRPKASFYLIWDDEDGVRIVDDPQDVFDRCTASIIAIDLTVIGARLMEHGKKPVVSLEANANRGQRRVRRLNGLAVVGA